VNKLLTYVIKVTLAYSSECSIRENADTIKKSAKPGGEIFV